MQNAQSIDLSAVLRSLPGWDKMTAYHRVLEACRELTKAGRKIPAWTALREMVGKGSPADIKRAVDDFRQQNAVLLSAGSLELEAVPGSVVKAFKGVWTLALREATDKFGAEREDMEAEIANLRQAVFQSNLLLTQETEGRRQAEERASALNLEIEKKAWESANKALVIAELNCELKSAKTRIAQLSREGIELSTLLDHSRATIETMKSREIDLLAQLQRAESRIDSLVLNKK
jgi:hypothetical protein